MALRANLLRTLLAAGLLLGANAGCPKKDGVPTRKGPDPDTNSGVDAKRGSAKPMPLNKAETDSVSWPKLQRTKWKRLDIQNPAQQNILSCELRIDNAGVDLNIDIFNGLGTQLGFSPGPVPNKLKKLAVPIDEVPGTYFVRMQAAQPKDESDFAVICYWDELPPTPEQPGPKPPRPRPGPKPPKPEPLEEKIEKGTEGRIVSSYRDDGATMLIIDKGAAAGVREGAEGTVLEGKGGRVPLSGGDFKVISVMNDGQCKAKSSVRSIGRNTRVVLFR